MQMAESIPLFWSYLAFISESFSIRRTIIWARFQVKALQGTSKCPVLYHLGVYLSCVPANANELDSAVSGLAALSARLPKSNGSTSLLVKLSGLFGVIVPLLGPSIPHSVLWDVAVAGLAASSSDPVPENCLPQLKNSTAKSSHEYSLLFALNHCLSWIAALKKFLKKLFSQTNPCFQSRTKISFPFFFAVNLSGGQNQKVFHNFSNSNNDEPLKYKYIHTTSMRAVCSSASSASSWRLLNGSRIEDIQV